MPTQVHPAKINKEVRKFFDSVINYNPNNPLHKKLLKNAHKRNVEARRKAGNKTARNWEALEREIAYLTSPKKKKVGCFGGCSRSRKVAHFNSLNR